jgi:hypothetical protein
MKAIVTQLESDNKINDDARANAHTKAQGVDERVVGASDQLAVGNNQEVFNHVVEV